MRRSAVIAGVAALVGAGALLWWSSRPAPNDEERIRALFQQAAEAAEARRPAGVMEVLSPRFRAQCPPSGACRDGMGFDEVRGLVTLELLRGGWVSVTLAGVEVAVDGPRARANVDAVLSRAPRGTGLDRLVPAEASAHRFSCELEAEGGDWRVVAARWRRIGLGEALEGPPRPGSPGAGGDDAAR